MKYSYYPGCTLKNKAKDLDAYARASAKALGFEMEEIIKAHRAFRGRRRTYFRYLPFHIRSLNR